MNIFRIHIKGVCSQLLINTTTCIQVHTYIRTSG